MGSGCFKPRAEDSLSVSGNNQPWTASSSSFCVSNHGGYTTHSEPSTTRAGIINTRASELGRNAGYALPPYVPSSRPPTTCRSKTNELARSSGYAQEPYASSSSRHAASFSNSSNDLRRSTSYTLPPYVLSSTPHTTCRSKTNELARSSGYAYPTTTTTTTT